MKVLFIQPPWGEVYGTFKSAAKVGNAFPPLGICFLSAILKQRGIETRLIDAEMENKSIDYCIEEAVSFNPNYICLTSASSIYHIASKLGKLLKQRIDAPLIVGGPHVTAMPYDCLKDRPFFDFGIYGEGEETLVELLDCLAGGKERREKIKGLIYRDESNEIKVNPPRPLLTDLDRLPIPDREGLELDRYLWSVPGKGIVRFTTIMTSRGCPFNCIFCSAHTVFGKKVRNRNINLVLDELEYLVYDLNIQHFSLIDDTWTLDHNRVREFCRGIKERKLDITWEGWTRANTVNEEILRIMKDAGFVRISFGIESGNTEILKHIRKGVKLEDYEKAYRIAAKVGIETRGSVMLGHPFETRKTAMETLHFIRDLKGCQQMYINITTPYPGTELYKMAKEGKGGIHLLTNDLSQYRRYGNSVIEVNDLKADDLVALQRKGFKMFYFTPGRIWYNIKRAGMLAAIRNAWAFCKSVMLPNGRER
ncbi:B12-binding domain-containing radical SAM protein [Thermodesulfobacteriota bacterium]